MKIKLKGDMIVTIFYDVDTSTEEFYSKNSIIEIDFVDFNTSTNKLYIFAMFQFGDGSVFSIPIDEFEIVESCEKYENDLLELMNQN